MKIFRLFVLLSVSMALTAAPTNISKSCWGGGEELTNPFYFFDQTIIGPTAYAPLFYTPRSFYTQEWYSDSGLIQENLDDWIANSRYKPGRGEVRFMVYGSDISYLRQVRRYVTGGRDTLNDSLRMVFQSDSLIRDWRERNDPSTVDYLLFAKACEPYVTDAYMEWLWSRDRGNYERIKPEAIETMDSLILVAREHAVTGPSRFLRIRYGYQAVRLAHYAGEYARCIGLYDTLLAPVTSASPIKMWALANKAGAQRALGMEAEAAHNFSLVFARDAGRRFSCFQSFRIRSDSVWQQCLNLCLSTDEKVMMYFLRGIRPRSDALLEMKEIYALDRSSDLLEILLVREVAKLEAELIGVAEEYPPFYRREQREHALGYLTELNAFIAVCVREGKTRQPEVWKLAEGYTDYMLGDAGPARAVFAELARESTNEQILSQVKVFELATSISQITTANRAVEDSLFTAVTAIPAPLSSRSEEEEEFGSSTSTQNYLVSYFLNSMAPVYESEGDTLKAFLCRYPLNIVKYNPTINAIDGFLTLAEKSNKSAFEKYLLEFGAGGRTAYLPYEDASPFFFYHPLGPVDFLKEIKATLFLADDHLVDAIRLYGQVPESPPYGLQADPFSSRINDCRDCDFKAPPAHRYYKQTLAQRLLFLQQKILERPDSAAQYHFLLGNAYYNMTHFGNSSEALDYNRNPEFGFLPGVYYGNSFQADAEYVDCSRALEHYDAAMRLAETKGDTERAAQCCFMAAKCEQNAFYTSKDKGGGVMVKNFKYRNYFKKMIKDFSATEYYEEALKECKYFNAFAQRH